MKVILGAGLSGLSASYHLGHSHCLVLEKSKRAFGHAKSDFHNGYTWDEGPHVSFTKHSYVKELFSESVATAFDEYEVRVCNWYHDRWIHHPAQSNFYQIPEPLRSQCLKSFLESRQPDEKSNPSNYGEWLDLAFGKVFARSFAYRYTRKYWTTEPSNLTTNWVGSRVFYPSIDEVIEGSKGPLSRPTHYITTVRYPRSGGFQNFGRILLEGASVKFGHKVTGIDLKRKEVMCADGNAIVYENLISSLPLPVFIAACKQATPDVLHAARSLHCSQLLIVNVEVPHASRRSENWIYVYDEDKYSTRIHFTEKLTPGNAPQGRSGIQVEVYFSRFKPRTEEPGAIASKVLVELQQMGLLDKDVDLAQIPCSTKWIEWANVIFTKDTAEHLDRILSFLAEYGLAREVDDLLPITDWNQTSPVALGDIALAGRFGQWKYFWSDDCILRGRYIGQMSGRKSSE
jgi:protoporphyrinogen oxidase